MRKLTYFVASTLDGFIAAGWPVTLLPEFDELVIKLYPIFIGSGVPMFAGEFGPYPVHHGRQPVPTHRS